MKTQTQTLDANSANYHEFSSGLIGAIRAIRVSLFCLLLAAAGFPAEAQIFVGGVGVYGSSNALVQYNFVPITNQAYSTLVGRTLAVQSVGTNEIINVAYGYVFSGMGLTNIYILATNQYTFPASNGWVQGSTFTTNISAINFTVNVQPVGIIGIYSNTTATIWSNNVIFQ